MAEPKVLCVYYSRSGNTKRVMEEIAPALNAELVELTDGVKRTGFWGFLRSGFDAVQQSTWPLEPYQTKYPINQYDLVVLGTPVWAGRCSSIAREFLKKNGKSIKKIGYVITRSAANEKYESVYTQMDFFTARPHCCGVSLHCGDVGESFWRDEFIKDAKSIVSEV